MIAVAGYRIEGHAIISADGCIAAADGATPAALRNDADWRRFQAALDEAAVVVLGRRSHAANPNTAGRNRLVMSSSAHGIERRDDGWWWNPAEAPLSAALQAAAPGGGLVAVPGGRLAFDFFLDAGFDAFHLARAERVRLPRGIPVFSGVGADRSPETVLAAAGLAAGPVETLDAAAGVNLVIWRRPVLTETPAARRLQAMEPSDVLKTIPFFADVLDGAEIEALASRAYFVRFPKGATPIEEDGPGHAMYVIVSGEATVTVHGDDEPLARLGKGSIVGEMSLLTGARRSATVTAATDLEAIEVNKEALAHVLKGSPDLVERFADLIDRRQKELDRLAGGSAWGMLRLGKAETASMIRAFFGKTI